LPTVKVQISPRQSLRSGCAAAQAAAEQLQAIVVQDRALPSLLPQNATPDESIEPRSPAPQCCGNTAAA